MKPPSSEILNPQERLIAELSELAHPEVSNVYVPEIDEAVIMDLTEEEAEIAEGVTSIFPQIGQLYSSYTSGRYTSHQEYLQANEHLNNEISDSLEDLSKRFVGNHRLSVYFSALSQDWREGKVRANEDSLSEPYWFDLAQESRVLPRMHPGLERYIKTGYEDGGDPSASVSIRIENETDGELPGLESSVIDYLDAREVSEQVDVRLGHYHFLASAALHGDENRAPIGSNYVYHNKSTGKTIVQILSYLNIQKKRNAEIIEDVSGYFSDEILNRVSNSIEGSGLELYGHEVTEALIERMYPGAISQLKGREAIELVSTLIPWTVLINKAQFSGGNNVSLVEDLSLRSLAKFIQRTRREANEKSVVYQRGYQLILDRLNQSGSLIRTDDGRIVGVYWNNFFDVIRMATRELLEVITNGDIKKNNELFALG